MAQEVFEDLVERLDTFDRSRPFRPWLFGVTLNLVLDYRKQRDRLRETTLPDQTADPRPLPDEVLDVHLRQQTVLRALEALETKRRAVFVMCELTGHTMPEIAESLEIPLNTAYSRLRLARIDFERAVRRHSLRKRP
jgi:RNA polymerase sigma-70 factor (ECF subfamily)